MNGATTTFVAIVTISQDGRRRFDLAFRKDYSGFERDHGLAGVKTCGLLQIAPLGSCWEIVVATRRRTGDTSDVRSTRLAHAAQIEVNGRARLSKGLEAFIEDAKTSPVNERPRRCPGPPKRRRSDRSGPTASIQQEAAYVVPPFRHERVVVSARRLVCVLRTDPEPDGATMLSEGIEVPYGGPPDWLAIGDNRIPSADWPCVGGRLFAPPEPDRRVIAIHDLDPRSILCRCTKLEVHSPRPEGGPIGWKDWRTDAEVIAAATETLQLGTTDASDAEAIAIALAQCNSENPPQDFLVGRLVEVARRRSNLPKSFTDALLAATGVDSIIDRESTARTEELETRLARKEKEAEQQLSGSLDTRRRELAQMEEKLDHLRAFEVEASRRIDDMRRTLLEAVDDRVSTVLRERLSALETSISARNATRPPAAPDIDLFHKLEETISTLRNDIDVLVERVDRQEEQAPSSPEETDSSVETSNLVSRTTTVDRAGTICGRAVRSGIAKRQIAIGAAIAIGGRMPVFVGPGGRGAALAVAEAITGGDAGIIHCGPTLLSVDDLLDSKRARTSTLLDTIQHARDAPWRWHAIAFIDLDWAPAGYWLHAFSVEVRASMSLPANVAFVASSANDGDRIPLPMSALLTTVPIEAVADLEPKIDKSQDQCAWPTAVEPMKNLEFRSDFARRAATTFDTDAINLKEMVDIASGVHELCHWTPEEAVAHLQPLSSWLRAKPPYDFGDPKLRSLVDSLIRSEGL